MALLLFILLSWGLLYSWLYLIHAINEKVSSTLPSSSLIRVLIATAAVSFLIQKKPGLFKSLILMTFGAVLIFLHAIVVLDLFLNVTPDIYDAVFYYECFLLMFFFWLPIWLLLRMV